MGAALDIHDESLVGQVLDERYEVLDLLGEGGMGLVYRARHVFSGGEVAVKVLRAAALSIPGVLERVEREAIAASSIGDAHIVDVRDFGKLPSGEPYMVMELLAGTELAELIHEHPQLPIPRVCHIIDQVARALGAAHEIGIVHRDLKSENVLLVERPDTADFVKLVDFGIAHVQNETSKITRAGELLGTPQYMSPEQCAGRPVDHRTDIYALGVLLYEMLTGKLPFDSEDLRTLLFAHMTTAPTPPGAHRPELPEELEAVVLRCLEKSPDARFSSMSEVSEALEQVPEYTPQGRYTPREVAESLRLVPATAPSLPPVAMPSSPPLAMSSPAAVSPTRPMGSTPMRRRAPTWLLALATAGAVLGVAGGAAWLATHVDEPATRVAQASSAAPPAPEPVESSPPADVAPERVPSAGSPSTTIELESVEGASVLLDDGALVGTVPIALMRPEGEERRVYVIELDGYQSRRVALSAVTSDTVFVPLTSESAPASAVPVRVSARRRARGGSARSDPEPQPAAEAGASEVLQPFEADSAEADPAPVETPQADPSQDRPTRRRPFLDPWD